MTRTIRLPLPFIRVIDERQELVDKFVARDDLEVEFEEDHDTRAGAVDDDPDPEEHDGDDDSSVRS